MDPVEERAGPAEALRTAPCAGDGLVRKKHALFDKPMAVQPLLCAMPVRESRAYELNLHLGRVEVDAAVLLAGAGGARVPWPEGQEQLGVLPFPRVEDLLYLLVAEPAGAPDDRRDDAVVCDTVPVGSTSMKTL